jgi:cysteine desulfurase
VIHLKIYLDNSATTPLREEVIEKMNSIMKSCYGNPSSLHRMGLEAEKEVSSARKTIAEYLNAGKDEIYFTSGGTESNNMAIQGVINKVGSRKAHIIVSKIEHPSVINVVRELQSRENISVDYVGVDARGIVDLDELESLISEDTVLVSIMMVNNETGAIQPVEKIKGILKSKSKNAYLHVDGVQAFGKLDIDLKSIGADLFSFSGHKIHAPKGIGGLYVRKGLNIKPMIYGGGQEKNLRSGTENTIGIAGMQMAVEAIKKKHREEKRHVENLKQRFLQLLEEEVSEFRLNSPAEEDFISNIVSLSFEGTRGEIILHSLEEKGIFISTTSACSSKDKTKSHVLEAMGLSPAEIEGSIRVSFSYQNTIEQIEKSVKEIKSAVEEIRSIMKR